MSDQVTITTNHQPRDIVNSWELTEAERAEFDYLNWEAIEDGRDSAEFFRYKGQLYDLHDTEPVGGCGMPDSLRGWDGFISETYFSGIVYRYPREEGYRGEVEIDGERVIVGRYYYS